MRQHIKKILILIPVVLLLNGCGVGGFLALSKLFTTIGKLWISFTKIFIGGRVVQQNPEATGQIIFEENEVCVCIKSLEYTYFVKNYLAV